MVRFDNGTLSNVQAIYVNKDTYDDADLLDYINTWDTYGNTDNRGTIIIKGNSNDSDVYTIFTLRDDISDNGSVASIPVSYVDGVIPSNTNLVVIEFIPAGSDGTSGSSGSSGTSGSSGSSGTSGRFFRFIRNIRFFRFFRK
jgi:hypothetical protein